MTAKIVPIKKNHSAAKLTEHDVWLIKGLLKEGLSPSVIASKFDVTHHSIYRIKNGETWQHVAEYTEEKLDAK